MSLFNAKLVITTSHRRLMMTSRVEFPRVEKNIIRKTKKDGLLFDYTVGIKLFEKEIKYSKIKLVTS